MWATTFFTAWSSANVMDIGRIWPPVTSFGFAPRMPLRNLPSCETRYQSYWPASGGALSASLPLPSAPWHAWQVA